MKFEFAFNLPVSIHFGSGQLERLDTVLSDRSIVTIAHAHARAAGHLDALERSIGPRCLDTFIHADGLPTLDEVERLCGLIWPLIDSGGRARRAGRPTVLALGGGASIDLAKAVCHRTADRNPETLVRWIREAGEHPKLEPLDLVAVPTTAGTGSEVTRWATLWDLASVQGGTVRGVKRSLESESGYPVIAVIDPLQTLTCPIEVTRDSGLDALSHALEALWNLNANPISDQFAIRAARLILSTLPDLLSQPSSTALRESMSLGALMAGLAFSQTRTALAHALSYPLTIDQGIPHGLACAIWLPTTMKLALGHSSQRDSLISSLFDSSTDPVSALSHWLGKMSVPEPRAALGTPDIEGRIAAALSHPRGRNFIGAHLCEPHTT